MFGLQKFGKNLILMAGGEPLLGTLTYYRFPERGAAWGGPFNGQSGREKIFANLVATIPFSAIVETGTYLGTTTEHLAKTGLPVFTVESQARNFGFARARLRHRRNVRLVRNDSRNGLAAILDGPLQKTQNTSLFFYLDAHWDDDLPLASELEIIFSRCPKAVVMIDDFAVPGDRGYAYDNYGPDKALNAAYIAPAVAKYGLDTFYPRLSSQQETGMRRGCAVLARSDPHRPHLEGLETLRLHAPTLE